MIPAVPTWVKYVAPLALGLLVGWSANGWRLGEQIAQTETKAARAETAAEHERAEAFRWVAAEQNRSTEAMAEADRKATEEIAHAESETSRLERCIADGRGCGLRVRIVRSAPAKCDGVPEAGAAAGVGDRSGEWAELSRGTALDILRLESAVRVAQEALKLCVAQWPK